ncbi:PEPxxWA-CTERM sorting domain-containing protein [uncultured Parasphingorhabdus sp.]|uniref:PEPxxWA-CTERM sorting domain-containing protein n=1 Tax=uncultured Parasphingorhabdus sp. TaxID=2709694 RepID=UPI0030D7D633|tara:strand:+ start:50789 stop:51439 length:651 start_codon:yes stop_codon:yes gene_type:complete
MKKFILLASALALAPATASHAAVTVSAEVATNPYGGPLPTYDFDLGDLVPIAGGTRYDGSVVSVATTPFGTDGSFYAVGPVAGSPAVLSLAAFTMIGSLSLSWGSVDTHNLLEVLDNSAIPNVLATITGTQIQGLVGTAGTYFPQGALVTLNFDGGTESQVGGLRFSSRSNAFEFDNIAVAPIPEPSIWAMMLLGFAAVGFSLRRRDKKKLRVRYA